jgi:hypothetical protein
MRFLAFVVVAATGCTFHPGGNPNAGPSDGRVDARVIDAPPGSGRDAAGDGPGVPVTTDHADVADTWLNSLATNSSMAATDYLIADGDNLAVILLQFDLSALAPGTAITAAELHIWTAADPGEPCSFYEVLEAWDEGTATWNSRANGQLWTTAGAYPPSRASTVAGTISPSATNTEYTVTIDPAVVASWVTTPATNFGLAMATVNNDGPRFESREFATVARRPYLRVTHVP